MFLRPLIIVPIQVLPSVFFPKDFGSGKELQLKDENGDKLIFNSMIDALNYMSKHGFEFVQAYAISVGGQNVYHYLLRRKTE